MKSSSVCRAWLTIRSVSSQGPPACSTASHTRPRKNGRHTDASDWPSQQVAVKLAIGRREMVEDQLDDRPGLVGVAEGRGRAGQSRQMGSQPIADLEIGFVSFGPLPFDLPVEPIETAEKLRITRAGGEVEVAQQLFEQGCVGIAAGLWHRCSNGSG